MNRLAPFFPWPLVGVAALLVMLVLLTPVLLSGGRSGLYTQAELVVDRTPGGNTTNFYVHAVGAAVRFQQITIAIAYGFVWSGGFPSGTLFWSGWENFTNVLAAQLFTAYNPVAVYVVATYSSGGTVTVYAGIVAFAVTSIGTSSETLNAAVSPTTSSVSVASTTSVASLPTTILLETWTAGGLP